MLRRTHLSWFSDNGGKNEFSKIIENFDINIIFNQVNDFLSSAIQSGGMYQNTDNTSIENFDFDMDILYEKYINKLYESRRID